MYHTSQWGCYIPEIHQIEERRFLSISRYKFKLRFEYVLILYRGIWSSRFGGCQVYSIFSAIFHTWPNTRRNARVCFTYITFLAKCCIQCIQKERVYAYICNVPFKKLHSIKSVRKERVCVYMQWTERVCVCTHTSTRTRTHTHTHTHARARTHTHTHQNARRKTNSSRKWS